MVDTSQTDENGNQGKKRPASAENHNEPCSKRSLRPKTEERVEFDTLPAAVKDKKSHDAWLQRFLFFNIEDCKGPVILITSADRKESIDVAKLYATFDMLILKQKFNLDIGQRIFVQWTLEAGEDGLEDDVVEEAGDSASVTSSTKRVDEEVLWGATLLGPDADGSRDQYGRPVWLIEYDPGPDDNEPSIDRVVFLSNKLVLHTDHSGYATYWEPAEAGDIITSCSNVESARISFGAKSGDMGVELNCMIDNLCYAILGKPSAIAQSAQRVAIMLQEIGLDPAQQRMVASYMGQFISQVRASMEEVCLEARRQGRESLSASDINEALQRAGYGAPRPRFPQNEDTK